jgi:hypothetical protein
MDAPYLQDVVMVRSKDQILHEHMKLVMMEIRIMVMDVAALVSLNFQHVLCLSLHLPVLHHFSLPIRFPMCILHGQDLLHSRSEMQVWERYLHEHFITPIPIPTPVPTLVP